MTAPSLAIDRTAMPALFFAFAYALVLVLALVLRNAFSDESVKSPRPLTTATTTPSVASERIDTYPCLSWLADPPWRLRLWTDRRVYLIEPDGYVAIHDWRHRSDLRRLDHDHIRLTARELAIIYAAARAECRRATWRGIVISNEIGFEEPPVLDVDSPAVLMLDDLIHEIETRYERERRDGLGRFDITLP